jgi:hypothetical protein
MNQSVRESIKAGSIQAPPLFLWFAETETSADVRSDKCSRRQTNQKSVIVGHPKPKTVKEFAVQQLKCGLSLQQDIHLQFSSLFS